MDDCGSKSPLPPPGKPVCDSAEIGDELFAELSACDLSFPVCLNGAERMLSFEQFLALHAQSIKFVMTAADTMTAEVDGCQLTYSIPEQLVCIVDGDGAAYSKNDEGCFVVPKACIVDDEDVAYSKNDEGCFVVPKACIVDDEDIAYSKNDEGCFVVPKACIVDGEDVAYSKNDEGCFVVPKVCIVDGEGAPYPLDDDGCFVIKKPCMVDGDGEAVQPNADGCFVFVPEEPEDTACGNISVEGTNITIGPDQVNQVNFDDFVTNSGTESLLYAVVEESADGVYILSSSGSNASFRSDHSSCQWSFEYTIACGGVVVGTGVVSGQLAAGSEIFGASLMNVDDFNQAVEGPVSPGNEFAPGWSNPDLNYNYNTYPMDTSIAIMDGDFDGTDVPTGGSVWVKQKAFDGDKTHGISAQTRWFYANGNTTGGPYIIAERLMTGIEPGAEYVFVVYVSNAIKPDSSFGDEPKTEFRIDGVTIGAPIPVLYENDHFDGVDTWSRQVRKWTAPAGVTQAVFAIYDAAEGDQGDDFALVVIGAQKVEVCQ